MKWIAIAALLLVFSGVAVAAWVRLAPSDPERWHRMPDDVRAGDLRNGAMRVVDTGEYGLARLGAIIAATPRTEVLAGSVAEGTVTYVTRSAGFGFPDYTTVRLQGDKVEVFGRARYGLSDMGVNAARIDGWLDALRQGG